MKKEDFEAQFMGWHGVRLGDTVYAYDGKGKSALITKGHRAHEDCMILGYKVVPTAWERIGEAVTFEEFMAALLSGEV